MKKGFTLIELLAVIVILALVALISVPMILNVIEKAKKSALQDSAYGIVEAANLYYANDLSKEMNTNLSFSCSKNKCISGINEIKYKGNIDEGNLIITKSGDTLVCIDNNLNYALKQANENKVTIGNGSCGTYQEENGTFEILDAIDVQIEELTATNQQLLNQIAALETELNAKQNKINLLMDAVSYVYSYTGSYQRFEAPINGTFKIQLWGASGTLGNYGSYTSGEIKLNKGEIIYIYIGGSASQLANTTVFNNGTSSGGGQASGGATDIRYFGNNVTPTETELIWNNAVGLRSRIMVAASAGRNAPGGGISGITYGTTGGTQISGGSGTGGYGNGGFGTTGGGCTGGTGWYGSGGGNCATGTGSGSSYISGHTGCVSITSNASSTPLTGCTTGTTDKNCSLHYSGKIFTNTVMIDGNGYNWTNQIGTYTGMPNYSNSQNIVGNSGTGYAKITFVSAN
ncbi:MAG: glycine-rich protein [Bacilli bacterium]|nr:glycine-rich protein [Bacilli bacterium]